MKKSVAMFAVAASLFLLSGHIFADEIKAESRLTQAAVYPDSALVTRTASLNMPAGEHQVVFADVIPDLDENTLKVSGKGSAQVRIFGAQVKKEFLKEKPAERVRQLEKEIEDLQLDKRRLTDHHHVLMQEREFLGSLRFYAQSQLPKEMVTKIPAVKDITDLLNLLNTDLRTNFAQALDAEIKIKDIDRKLDVLRKELAGISTTGMLKRFIVVDVQVLKAGTLEMSISYLIRGASWRSVYDARASLEKGEVELVSYAMVRQATGEDWTDIDITLSTSKPTIGGRMPYVAPWFLRIFSPRPAASRQDRKSYESYYAQSTAIEYQAAPMDEAAGIGGPMQEEAKEAYAAAQEKGTGVVYRIPRRATVKSDGTEYKLPIGAQILKSEFKYATYPRVSDHAYLRTTVVNTQEMQLPAGSVNIFLEGDFVGRSGLDNIGPGEKFDLYLGVDENVKVKRELVEKKSDDVLVGGIPSPNIKLTFAYKVTLENYKTRDISIYFFETMPVSQDERIKARILSVKPEPKEKDWEDRKGVWRWEVVLKSKEKKEIFYSFLIEYPRGVRIEGI